VVPYSMDLRERVVEAVDAGEGTRVEIAERFGVSDRWIRKLLQKRDETGSIEPRPHGGGRQPAFQGRKLQKLQSLIDRQPDATLQELQERTGSQASLSAVSRTLRKLGYSRKKVATGRRTRAAGREASAPTMETGLPANRSAAAGVSR
jgi:transposase